MKINEAIKIISEEIRLICIGAILFGVIVGAYTFTVKDVFKATVVISDSRYNLNINDISLRGFLGASSFLPSSSSKTHQDIKAILDGNKIYKDFILQENLLPVIFEDEWDSEIKNWKNKEKDFYDGVKVLRDATNYFYSFENGKTYISFVWSNPNIAAEWVNKLAIRANNFISQNEINSINKTLNNLSEISQKTIVNNDLKNQLNQQVNNLIIETTLKKAEPTMGLTIFEKAIPPKKRIWPKRTLSVILGVFVGGFISAAFIILRRLVKEEK